MSRIELISQAGGLFACLVFIHFFSDFLFQSHAEAMVKHKNHKIRAKHCAILHSSFPGLCSSIFRGGNGW